MVMRDPKGGFSIPNVKLEKSNKALVSRAGLHGILQIFDTTDLGQEFAKCLPADGSNRSAGNYKLGILWIACLLSGFDCIDDCLCKVFNAEFVSLNLNKFAQELS